jgi:protein TonB
MSPSATTVPIHEIPPPQPVRGNPPGSAQPRRSVVSRGTAPTRAFLTEALLESHRFKSGSKSMNVLLALLVHIVVLGGPILAGLYYTETINLKQFTSTLLVAPPPPPPPPPAPAVGAVKPQASKRVFLSAGKLLAPAYIPSHIAQLKEAPIESDAFAGGVPGGIPGGQLGGVVGGVIGGVLNTGVKPVPPPPTGKSSGPVRVGGRVRPPRAIVQVQPEYPPLARQTRVQGEVKIDAILDEQGNVIDMKVVSGHPLLYQAALDALKKWKYEPTHLNDKPIAVKLVVTITFQLSQ